VATSEAKDDQADAVHIATQIESAKRQLESMIDSAPSVMLLVDAGGTILRCNMSLLRLLGRSGFAGVLGSNLRDVFISESPDVFNWLCECCGGEKVHETRARVSASGSLRDFRFTAVSPGRAAGSCVVVVNDVTDEKQQAVEAAKANKQEAVHALAGALMHNLNQSLTIIMVQTHLMLAALEKGELDPEAMKRDLGGIGEHALKISNVLRQVERSTEYVTESYPGHLNILDLTRM
jgi:PAS domain S-box-containing protein